jgi:hypothetical protein
MLVETVVNGCRNPSNRMPVVPGQKVSNLGVLMVRVLGCQEADQSQQAVPGQITTERWCPARVISVQIPGEFSERLDACVPQRDLLDL